MDCQISQILMGLKNQCISLPEKKHTKTIDKIDSFLFSPNLAIMQKVCASIHGLLQHISFMYKEGRSTLPLISSFLSKFPNDFSHHHILHSVLDCLTWWKAILSIL